MSDSMEEFYKQYHVNLVALFGVIIIIYIGIFSLFNNISVNTPEARPWIAMIELCLWILFIVIVFLNIKHFSNFDFNFNHVLFNLFGSKKPELEIHVHKPRLDASRVPIVDVSRVTIFDVSRAPVSREPVFDPDVPDCKRSYDPNVPGCKRPKPPVDISHNKCTTDISGEVFHIPHNRYTYEQAKDACELLDARLATYDEVEDSYKNGANWCSYGWSNDQLALFPIQKSMYNELKKIPGHERDCGRVGINGGYIKNRNSKFGVNCYGKKPYATNEDLAQMKNFSFAKAFPDAEQKRKEKEKKMREMMIAPFNKDKWNS